MKETCASVSYTTKTNVDNTCRSEHFGGHNTTFIKRLSKLMIFDRLAVLHYVQLRKICINVALKIKSFFHFCESLFT
jgi:hypothetical protein